MAGVATLTTTLTVTGLGDNRTFTNTKALTVPVAMQDGYTVLATATTTALQLFAMVDHIALAKIYLVWIKAEVGTVYILPDTAGTATFAAAAADFIINAGEAHSFPINPAGNLGFCIDGSAVTAAISWVILGQV